MALELVHPYKGIGASYWKISHADHNYKSDVTQVTLSLYKDQESRNASPHNELYSKVFVFTGADLTRAELYTKIKEPIYTYVGDPPEQVQTNIFVDAADV